MLRSALLFSLVMCAATMAGQKRLVVADVETREPVVNANVILGPGYAVTTDSLGRFLLPDSCRGMALSHVNYESRLVNVSEVRDTVFLISKLLSTQEVVVFGKDKYKNDLSDLNKRLKIDKTEMQLATANPNGGNLLGLIGKLLPKSRKQKRKDRLKKILDDY